MAALIWTSCRYQLEWVLFIIYLVSMPIYVKSECQAHPTFIACQRSLPKLEHLVKGGQGSHVFIRDYDGELSTDIPEGYGNYTVQSLQVSQSRITKIQPRFFARFSNGKLGHLMLSGVTGSLYLDSETLGGLEDVLHTLYVMNPVVHDVSYLAKLSRLSTVSLLRTGLKELPTSFVRLLRNVDKLDLSSNELTTLPWGEVTNRIMDITFNELKLTKNQWHCDCSLRPVVEAPLEAKRKIINFECKTPADVAALPLRALSVESICPEAPPVREDGRPNAPGSKDDKNIVDVAPPDSGGEPLDPSTGDRDQSIGEAQGEPVKVATAGGISTEVIAVIIAVVAVVAIVLIAVIVFKVRSRNQRHRKQDADKQPSHKSSAYCHVIEHPNSKGAAHGRSSGTGNSGATVPPVNNYNKDLEDSERQPLAPPYYSRDPRL